MFSVYEEHTRWIRKQKAGTMAELGVPACVREDTHPFIFHHMIQWEGTDVDAAVPLLTETKKRYGAVVSCSVDRGFYSPDNLTAFEAELGLAVMSRKAIGTEASRERERAEAFVAARRQHSAIESAINNLEHRGLNRVRVHGKEGFARSVALSVVATNVHRLGLILRQRETLAASAPASGCLNKQAAETAEKDDAHEQNRIATPKLAATVEEWPIPRTCMHCAAWRPCSERTHVGPSDSENPENCP